MRGLDEDVLGNRRAGRDLNSEGVRGLVSKSRNGSRIVASQVGVGDCSELLWRRSMPVSLGGGGSSDEKLLCWHSFSSFTVGVLHSLSATFVSQSLIRSLVGPVRLKVRFREPAMK